MSFRTLIIEDEEPARMRLLKMLEMFPERIEIIGFATNGEEGLEKINQWDPDLIFLDIQMPYMNGFEMLSKLEKAPMIIFCTAYDEFALQAFETNSIDYLLKPVKKERLEKSLEKLEKFKPSLGKNEMFNFLKSIEAQHIKPKLTSLTVKSGKKILLLKLNEILYFKASDKYISIFMNKGEEYLSDQSLQSLEAQLPANFKRIHRSVLINSDFIREVHPYFNSRLAFVLEDIARTKLISGRYYKKEIKEWIDI